jgi:hypothetical protein
MVCAVGSVLPRIAWDSVLGSATLTTAATNVAGGGVTNVRDWRPWSFWRPTGGGPYTFDADLGGTKTVNAWALAGHDATGVVSLSTWNGAAWVVHSQVTASGDGSVIYLVGDPVSTTKVRFTFAALTYLAIAWTGLDMELPEGIGGGWTDPPLALRAKTSHEISRGGQWLGTSVEQWNARLSLKIDAVAIAWARTYWLPFLRKCATQPFFLHWNITDAPAAACFCTGADFGDAGFERQQFVSLSVTFDADTGYDRRLSP